MSNKERVEHKLAAILHADVQGYSRLMGEDEETTLHTLTAYRRVIDALIEQYRGRIVGTAGDSVLAEFASAVDAVQGAIDIQHALKSRNAHLPAEQRMEFRIGINVGDVIVEGPQIYGDGVNIAARLEALAGGGEICISGTVYDQVENKLALGYESLGEQTVKNIAKPVRVYRVVEPDTTAIVQGKGESTSPLQPPALPLPDKPSIIVLPFVNMSNDPEQEYFSDGITEDITTALYKISSLFVISRNSAFTYKGKVVKGQDISRELGVRYILEGSVRKAGERVRISAQLIDATTDHHLWAERYDRLLTGIFAVQEEIGRKIVVHLALKLSDAEEERLEQTYTTSFEAYDALLRGKEQMWRFTKEANSQARLLFERAIELDPTYAVAYLLVGATYLNEWTWQWNQDPQSLEHALALAQKALVLDESLPYAHELVGWVYLWKRQPPEQAVAKMEQAIALSPNFYSAYAGLGTSLNYAGRPAEAITAIEQALRLNPRNPRYVASYLTVIGRSYGLLRRYEEAIAAFKRALDCLPFFPLPYLFLAGIYSELGQEEKARAEATKLMQLHPAFSLEGLKQRLPYEDPAESERFFAALRKAGLK